MFPAFVNKQLGIAYVSQSLSPRALSLSLSLLSSPHSIDT